MRKKTPKESEKQNLLSKKSNADQKWDDLFERMNQGEKVDRFVIAQVMNECNWADYGLMERGFREYLSNKD